MIFYLLNLYSQIKYYKLEIKLFNTVILSRNIKMKYKMKIFF